MNRIGDETTNCFLLDGSSLTSPRATSDSFSTTAISSSNRDAVECEFSTPGTIQANDFVAIKFTGASCDATSELQIDVNTSTDVPFVEYRQGWSTSSTKSTRYIATYTCDDPPPSSSSTLLPPPVAWI